MKLVTNIGSRSGNGTAIEADWDKLPQVSQEAIIRYGFQRFVNDRVGGSSTTAEQKVTAANEIVARLVAGDVGRATRSSVDPVRAKMYKRLRKALSAKQPEVAKKLRAYNAEEVRAFYDGLLDKMPEDKLLALEKDCRAEIKRRAEQDAKLGEIDLGEIDL